MLIEARSPTRTALLQILVQTPGSGSETSGGWRLQDLADKLGMAPPTVLRHLEVLANEGAVEKRFSPRGRAPRYFARPFFQALWVDPARGIVETSWVSGDAFSWTFPLVSRVPDSLAQQTLLRLLPRAMKNGLLTPQGRDGKPDPAGGLPAVAVFGSCARGDARPDSDLDLLVRTENRTKGFRERFRDFVARFNLDAPPRTVQSRFLSAAEYSDASKELKEALRREAVTVWLPATSDEFIESLHLSSLGGPGHAQTGTASK